MVFLVRSFAVGLAKAVEDVLIAQSFRFFRHLPGFRGVYLSGSPCDVFGGGDGEEDAKRLIAIGISFLASFADPHLSSREILRHACPLCVEKTDHQHGAGIPSLSSEEVVSEGLLGIHFPKQPFVIGFAKQSGSFSISHIRSIF